MVWPGLPFVCLAMVVHAMTRHAWLKNHLDSASQALVDPCVGTIGLARSRVGLTRGRKAISPGRAPSGAPDGRTFSVLVGASDSCYPLVAPPPGGATGAVERSAPGHFALTGTPRRAGCRPAKAERLPQRRTGAEPRRQGSNPKKGGCLASVGPFGPKSWSVRGFVS